MGAKYTSQATSGYNASPPPDDGSQTASNLVTWTGIKSKIGDVLKTFGEAINTSLVAASNTSVRQITVADSTVAGDHMRTIEIAPTVSNTVTVSLGDAATMSTTYLVAVRNSSTISQIISRATAGDKIDGVAGNITIPSKGTLYFTTNSVPDGYLSLARFGPVIDSDPIVVGGTDGTKKIRFEVDGLTTGTTRVITVPDTDLTLPAAATQAEQEAGSSITAYTSPGRQQFHPSAAKAWCIWDGAGNIIASYNVTSVTDSAVGDQLVNLTTAFSSSSYVAIAGTRGNWTSGNAGTVVVANVNSTSTTASVIRVITAVVSTGAFSDPSNAFTVVAYGDQ